MMVGDIIKRNITKNNWVHILIIFIMTMPVFLEAQKMSIAKDSFLIGEPIELTVQPVTSSGDRQNAAIDFSKIKNLLYLKDTTVFDQYADVSLDSISSGDAQVIEKSVVFKSSDRPIKIHFTIFSLGVFSIYNGTDSLVIKITPPPGLSMQNPQEIKDIKPIIENTEFDYATLLYFLLGIMALLAIGYLLYKKYRNKNTEAQATKTDTKQYVSPYDEAMTALQNLIVTRQYESADVKAFQTILTDILRQYTSRQYEIKSFELTSYEIIDALKTKDKSFQNTQILTEVFSLSDQVKFAKARPGHELCKEAVEKAIYFIENSNH